MDRREFVKALLSEAKDESIADRSFDIDVVDYEIAFRRPYTIARMNLLTRDSNKIVYGWGAAKVCWPDEWNPERGREIALAKAAQHIAEQVYNES